MTPMASSGSSPRPSRAATSASMPQTSMVAMISLRYSSGGSFSQRRQGFVDNARHQALGVRGTMSNTSQLFRFAGWSAYVNAVAGVIGFVSLFVFFAVDGLWGFINDISSIPFFLSLIPPALAWHRL